MAEQMQNLGEYQGENPYYPCFEHSSYKLPEEGKVYSGFFQGEDGELYPVAAKEDGFGFWGAEGEWCWVPVFYIQTYYTEEGDVYYPAAKVEIPNESHKAYIYFDEDGNKKSYWKPFYSGPKPWSDKK
jgi:hypothetical protein